MPVTETDGAPRTAIITVDDDPGVSRAVARDLRRHYGEQHRIVRAESGESALDALRQMKLRGDMVVGEHVAVPELLDPLDVGAHRADVGTDLGLREHHPNSHPLPPARDVTKESYARHFP